MNAHITDDAIIAARKLLDAQPVPYPKYVLIDGEIFNAVTGESVSSGRILADRFDTDMLNDLLTGDIGTLHGFVIKDTCINEHQITAWIRHVDS